MRRALSAVALVVGLLAACSRSSDDAARPAATTTTAPVPSTETSTTTTSTAPTTTTTRPSGPERCRTSTLQIGQLESQAALGHGLGVFELRNTSRAPCRLEGYPAVELLDPSGRVLAQGQRRPGHMLADRPPAPVTIAPGGAAFFGIEWLNVCPDGDPETESHQVRAIPPGETAPLVVGAAIPICPRPDILVSPFRSSPEQLTAA